MTDDQSFDLRDALEELHRNLPEGWLFAGVLRRADAPFVVSDEDMWTAFATVERSESLGIWPEKRGSGPDAVQAIISLSKQFE